MTGNIIHSGGRLLLLAGALLLAGCGIFGGGDEKTTPTLGDRQPILSGESDAQVDADMRSISVILPPAQPNADWPQSGGNAAKNAGHVTLTGGLQRIWTRSTSGSRVRRTRAGSRSPQASGLKISMRRALARRERNSWPRGPDCGGAGPLMGSGR